MPEEELDVKGTVKKIDDWMLNNKMLIAIICLILLLISGTYIAVNWNDLFKTRFEFTTPNGYNCTEVWRFKWNLTPLCELPDTSFKIQPRFDDYPVLDYENTTDIDIVGLYNITYTITTNTTVDEDIITESMYLEMMLEANRTGNYT